MANSTFGALSAFRKCCGINSREEVPSTGATIRDFGVVFADGRAPMQSLSGGNQQKVLIGRTARTRGSIYILHNPTSSVDVGARKEIIEIVRKLAQGSYGAVLYVSNDFEGVAYVCDRAYVMRDGIVDSELERAELTAKSVAELALG